MDFTLTNDDYDKEINHIHADLARHDITEAADAIADEAAMEAFVLDRRLRDSAHIAEAAKILLNNVGVGSSSREFFTADGRFVRILFPGGEAKSPWEEEGSVALNCVTFFGRRPRLPLYSVDNSVLVAECNRTDKEMRDSMDPGVVAAYMTMQVHNGDGCGK